MGIMFSPDMLELVLSGEKTQTRRKVDEIDSGVDVWDDRMLYRYDREPKQCTAVYQNKIQDWGWTKVPVLRLKWKVGKDYAVQPGRGKKGVGRIQIYMIRLETFASISQADAVAEGFTDPAGFHAKIRDLYGQDFDLNQPCWALTFSLMEAKATP